MGNDRSNRLKARTLAVNVAALSLGDLAKFWEDLGADGRRRLHRARELWDEDHAERRSNGDDEPYHE